MVELARVQDSIRRLHGLDVTGLGDERLLEYWRGLEQVRCGLPSLEHPLVLEVEARGLP
ncbi:MAG: hypothetical protein QOI15_1336, partial [Pseudonocardiales bacterium]|nr:hypothetical protein [Pseudonocardiales bacterium]